jgi:hypothetical protein
MSIEAESPQLAHARRPSATVTGPHAGLEHSDPDSFGLEVRAWATLWVMTLRGGLGHDGRW